MRCIVCWSLFSLFFVSCTVLVLVTACHCCCPMHSALCTMKHNGALPSHVCTCAVRPAFSQSVIIHHSYLLHSLQCAPEQLIQCSILKITVLFYIPFYIHKKNMCLNLFPQHFCHPGLKLHCEDRPLKEWCSSPREMQCRVVVKRESSIASVEKG